MAASHVTQLAVHLLQDSPVLDSLLGMLLPASSSFEAIGWYRCEVHFAPMKYETRRSG